MEQVFDLPKKPLVVAITGVIAYVQVPSGPTDWIGNEQAAPPLSGNL